jgi:hypothetical protein
MVLDEGMSPRQVVTGLLAEADAMRDGRVLTPVGMLQRVDAARGEIARLRLAQHEKVGAG